MTRKITFAAIAALVFSLVGLSPAHAADRTVSCGTSGTYSVTGTVVTTSSSCIGSVTFDNTITAIGPRAFDSCLCGANTHAAITSISFGSSLTNIGDFAFWYATGEVTDLVIPNSVTDIGNRAFANRNVPPSLLTSLTLGDHVVNIGDQAFSSNPALQTLNLPSSLTWVGPGAFSDSAITSLRIPSSMRTVSSQAFEWMQSLTEIYFEDGVQVISTNAFYQDNAIASIRLPETLTEIEFEAFSSATALTEIRIPNSVESIGDDAFSSSQNVTRIYIGTGLIWLGTSVFASDWLPGPSSLECLTNASAITESQLYDAGIEIPVPACPAANPPTTPTVLTPEPRVVPNLSSLSTREASTTGGSNLTLTGDTLGDVTSVSIGGASAKMITRSATLLVIELPSHTAGIVDLVLSSPNSVFTLQDAINYISVPAVQTLTRASRAFTLTAASQSMSKTQLKQLDAMIMTVGNPTTITCAVSYSKYSPNRSASTKAKMLASSACTAAKKIYPNLKAVITATPKSGLAASKQNLVVTVNG